MVSNKLAWICFSLALLFSVAALITAAKTPGGRLEEKKEDTAMDIDEHMRHFRRGMEQAARVTSDPICSEYWKRDGEDKPVDGGEFYKNRKVTVILKNNRRFTGLTRINAGNGFVHYHDESGNDYLVWGPDISAVIAAPPEPAGE